MSPGIFGGLLVMLLGGTLAAQSWQPLSIPARSHHGMVFDTVRNRIVVFGGSRFWQTFRDTWEFDGTRWHAAASQAWPLPPSGPVVFDIARSRTVLFGGGQNGQFGETWEHNGTTWSQRILPLAPQARERHAIVFDTTRNRTVLFGGLSGGPTLIGDTWQFDGTAWVRTNQTGPSRRFGAAMAFDPLRGRTVLFGGTTSSTANGIADTWEHDGTSWSRVVTPTVPPARWEHAMQFEATSGRIVMFGGRDGSGGQFGDTWLYDGSDWTLSDPMASPSARSGHAMVRTSSRGGITLFGGFDGGGCTSDTWQFDPTSGWRECLPAPGPRFHHVACHDWRRGKTVVFGGLGIPLVLLREPETWEFDGVWRQCTPATMPPFRNFSTMVFNRRDGRAMLFGGHDLDTFLGDTWVYDGLSWLQLVTTNAPSPRMRHSMAYDSRRGVVVLFGGQGNGHFTDTWEHDGASWQQRLTPASPLLFGLTLMAYDEARARIVLVGRANSGVETWEFDGLDWQQVITLRRPPQSFFPTTMDYDPVSGRIVLVPDEAGGYGTWEYDGTDWTRTTTWVSGAPTGYSSNVVYEPGSGRLLVLHDGGTDVLVRERPAQPGFTRYGVGCPGSTGVPVLGLASGSPGLGATIPIRVTSLPGPAGFVYIAVGRTQAQWNGTALPFHLDAWGRPDCMLWIAPEAGVLVPSFAGVAVQSVVIPNLPVLAGTVWGMQALSLDPAAGPLGLTLSNGAILRLW